MLPVAEKVQLLTHHLVFDADFQEEKTILAWIPVIIELFINFLKDDDKAVRAVVSRQLIEYINVLQAALEGAPSVAKRREVGGLASRLSSMQLSLTRTESRFVQFGPRANQPPIPVTNQTLIDGGLLAIPEKTVRKSTSNGDWNEAFFDGRGDLSDPTSESFSMNDMVESLAKSGAPIQVGRSLKAVQSSSAAPRSDSLDHGESRNDTVSVSLDARYIEQSTMNAVRKAKFASSKHPKPEILVRDNTTIATLNKPRKSAISISVDPKEATFNAEPAARQRSSIRKNEVAPDTDGWGYEADKDLELVDLEL